VLYDKSEATTTACQHVHEYIRTRCTRIFTYTILHSHLHIYICVHVLIQTCKQRAVCPMTTQMQRQQYVNMYTNTYVHDVYEYVRERVYVYIYIHTCTCTYTNLQLKSCVPHYYRDVTTTACQYVHEYARTRCI